MARKPTTTAETLRVLDTNFGVARRELAGLFLYLALMPERATLRCASGVIRKESATTFSLAIDAHTLATLVEDYFAFITES